MLFATWRISVSAITALSGKASSHDLTTGCVAAPIDHSVDESRGWLLLANERLGSWFVQYAHNAAMRFSNQWLFVKVVVTSGLIHFPIGERSLVSVSLLSSEFLPRYQLLYLHSHLEQ